MNFSQRPVRARIAFALRWSCLVSMIAACQVHAQSQADSQTQTLGDAMGQTNRCAGLSWFACVDLTQEEQPHWITPIVTVTPRLEEEYRYDQIVQYKKRGVITTNFGAGKGLELIPSENTEIIVGQPNYISNQTRDATTTGFADETMLLKYRIAAANEESGNYIVTAFMGLSLPTGDTPFSTHHTIYTPTIAAGKGWGTRDEGVDVQSTLSVSVPDGDAGRIGIPIVSNTAIQAHVLHSLWPELEVSYTHWDQGPVSGKSQLILTYGVIVGRIPLEGRAKLILGLGYQSSSITSYGVYDRAWLATGRVAF